MLDQFIREKTTPLPGDPPIESTMKPATLHDTAGTVWRRAGLVAPPEAIKFLRRGANVWISDAGQWPPRVVPAEFAAELLCLLDDRWIDLDDWRNLRWSDFEYDSAIQLWRRQREKQKPPKRRKGQPPEPVSLLVHTFYV